MTPQVRIQILKSPSGQEYQLAINGILLNGKSVDGSSMLVSTDQLASIFSMPELQSMVERKKFCERYAKDHFVSNKELAEWLNAKKGRRCHVVYPNQMIRDGRIYTEWHYPVGNDDYIAASGFEIYVVEAGTCTLEFLTRKVIGLN